MKELKFIHITKTAGTSIENIARKFNLYWGRFDPEYCQSFKHHPAPWHDLPSNKPNNVISKYDWFIVVRNPYTRMISEFHCKWGGVGDEAGDYTCEQFNKKLRQLIKKRISYSRGKHFTPQYLYLDNNNAAKINVLQFEYLNRDFEELMGRYNIDIVLDQHAFNAVKQFGITSLDQKTIDLINKLYKKDFEMFGYEMK